MIAAVLMRLWMRLRGLANAPNVEPCQLLAPDSSENNGLELLLPYVADGSFYTWVSEFERWLLRYGYETAQKRFGTFSKALSILAV